MTYVGSSVVYVGSHLGNSQIIRIHPSAVGDAQNNTLPIPDTVEVVVDPSYLMREDEPVDDQAPEQLKSLEGLIVQTKGTFVEVLETFHNIAPIVDAVSADIDGSGQPQLVTCSGGGNKGSLNFVRTGADFNELAVLREVPNVTKIWPIRARFESRVDTHILVSTSSNTLLFRLDGGKSFHTLDPESIGIKTTSATLGLANVSRRVTKSTGGRTTSSYVDSSLIVHVTSQSVSLIEYDEALGSFHPVGDPWTPSGHDYTWAGREIVAASINPSQIVVGLSEGRLVLLNINEAKQFQVQKYRDFSSSPSQSKEICAISCLPFDPSKHFSLYIAVSFWGENSVTVLSLERPDDYMATVYTSPPLPSLPGTLLMYNFGLGRKTKDADYHPHVLAGLLDGTVVAFSFKKGELRDKRIYSLGSLPVSLSTCIVDGRRSVFATGSRSSVFYWNKQRLQQSHILLKGINTGVSINTPSFSSCLILASSSTLSIGQVRGVDKTQLRTINLGIENPMRVGYHNASNQFGVACLHTTPEMLGEPESFTSTFSLFDGNSFSRSVAFSCESGEEITTLRALDLLLPGVGIDGPTFVIGTVRHNAGEHGSSTGRLLILVGENYESPSPTTIRRVKSITSTHTDGCVYALDASGDLIVAGIESSVIIYRIQTSGIPTITQVAKWNHNYLVTNLVYRDSIITVGDAISSISMLRFEGDRLKTIARDYNPLWPVALEMTPSNDVVGATTDCDIFTFSLDTSSTPTVLEQRGSFQFGEVVTKFLPGAITYQDATERKTFQPEHVFFTSSGRIALISQVDDETALKLTALQRNMENVIKGPGTVSHSKWRAPIKTRRKGELEPVSAVGFLDGDFLEQFLTHPDKPRLLRGETDAEKIAFDSKELEGILEKLQSLH